MYNKVVYCLYNINLSGQQNINFKNRTPIIMQKWYYNWTLSIMKNSYWVPEAWGAPDLAVRIIWRIVALWRDKIFLDQRDINSQIAVCWYIIYYYILYCHCNISQQCYNWAKYKVEGIPNHLAGFTSVVASWRKNFVSTETSPLHPNRCYRTEVI